MDLAGITTVIAVALAFEFTNGFHDAANTIATSVSTRALTPRAAVLLAASMTFVGALLSTGVAVTVGTAIIEPPAGDNGLGVIFAALVGATAWNLLTWYLGLPTSSTHALIGGLIGAALAASTGVQWARLLDDVVLPMLLALLAGFGIAYLLMVAIMWLCRSRRPGPVNRRFRVGQVVSAAALGLGHGLQDAQKTMGVIVLALVTAGHQDDFDVPLWVILAVALVLAAGTYTGGWRIVRTLGFRIVNLDPARGFAAESTAAGVLYVAAIAYQAPVSTTQTVTSAVVGAGVTRRLSAARWGLTGRIVLSWILTVPAAGVVAAASYLVLDVAVRA